MAKEMPSRHQEDLTAGAKEGTSGNYKEDQKGKMTLKSEGVT